MKLNVYSDKHAIREVLGSFINNPSLIQQYKLDNSDFPEVFHRLIFAAINNLHKSGIKVIDAVTIDEFLSKYQTQHKIFEKNNGVDFIMSISELANEVNIQYYYDRLKKFSLLRSYVENGICVDEFFNPDEIDPNEIEKQMEKLDESTTMDIINHFKKKLIKITSPFIINKNRDSKKAGVNGFEQKERWKKGGAWGIGYSSAYVTTILQGMRDSKFILRSAGTNVGKTRLSIGDLAASCAPKIYDLSLKQWVDNPNGVFNGGLYIGTEMKLLEEIDPILWSYMSGVPQDHIEFNLYEGDEEARVDEAIRLLEEEANIWFEHVPSYDISAIYETIEKHIIEHKIKRVFFDYIHTTAELIAEFGARFKVKMATREDQVLANLSTKIKDMTDEFGISMNAGTQIIPNNKTENISDESMIRGAKAIADKTDSAQIVSIPTEKELKKVESIYRTGLGVKKPNLIISIYKNRGKWKRVKVWVYVDYNTMRLTDLFVTDYEYKLIKDIKKTYINVQEEVITSETPIHRVIGEEN